MADIDRPVTELSDDQCWNHLAGMQVGRLATILDDSPEIFPVNFVVDGQSVVFRTAQGSKLLSLTIHDKVAFESDGWDEDGGWSVVIKGRAEQITDHAELARAEKAPLMPWVPTVKPFYVRITADEITGRLFAFGDEPSPDFAAETE